VTSDFQSGSVQLVLYASFDSVDLRDAAGPEPVRDESPCWPSAGAGPVLLAQCTNGACTDGLVALAGAQCNIGLVALTGAQCNIGLVALTGAQCNTGLVALTGAQCNFGLVALTGAQCTNGCTNRGLLVTRGLLVRNLLTAFDQSESAGMHADYDTRTEITACSAEAGPVPMLAQCCRPSAWSAYMLCWL
jgi:hypothetical protein